MAPTICASADHPIAVVTLRGGLGNQLFQYAIGRAIAQRQGRMLVLDDKALEVDHPGRTKRRYELFAFEIQAALTSQVQVACDGARAVVMQDRRGFHGHVLAPNPFPHIELHGFWQHESYFADIAHIIRSHFRMKPGPWDADPWQRRIEAARNAVCVHVRRTDYLNPINRLQFAGSEYYRHAIGLMKRDVPDCHFFVFSDDLPWCKENLQLDGAHSFVEHREAHPDLTQIDFRLMTMCRHFIIANSSYSWWTAWLGGDAAKIVVAPHTWFDIAADSIEITPKHWLRL